ncbi:MAG: S-layer homology domain-containing protein, partial [Acidimicrobiaceae bacterium]|nr:S-layer homology domain-containing protein [Acidimicrobiaceae bacterium]
MTTTPPSGEPEEHGSNGRQGGRRGRDGRLRRVWERRASRLAVGVAITAVVLTATAVAVGQGIGTFRDVPNDHYARDAVQWAVVNGITVGCGDGTYFCPETDVNRAQSVTFLHRYHNNVIRSLENRVRALESGSVGTTDPNTGFGNQPTPTTVPPRTFTT